MVVAYDWHRGWVEAVVALSGTKIKGIVADAKADRYGSITNLCKKKKITRDTYYKIQKKHNFTYGENAHIVEAGVMVETAKRHTKSVQESRAIDKAIQERISTTEYDNEIIENNRKLSLMLQKKIIDNKEDIELKDVKTVSGTLKDLESIANPKSNTTEINTQVNTQVNEIKVTFEE